MVKSPSIWIAWTESEQQEAQTARQQNVDLPIIQPSAQELDAHETWIKQFEEKHGTSCLFAKMRLHF